MKLKLLFLIFLNSTLAHFIEDKKDSKIIAKVILDFVKVFIEHKSHINILKSKIPSNHQNEIITELAKENSFPFTLQERTIKIKKFGSGKQTKIIYSSPKFHTIVLLDSLEIAKIYINYYIVQKFFNGHVLILIYCENENFIHFMMHELAQELGISRETFLIYNVYFIITENSKIHLVTFDWFTENNCEKPKIKIINSFDTERKTWENSLTKYEKFRNFHNCEIVFGVMVTNAVLGGGAKLINNGTDVKYHGLTVEIMNFLSNHFNFKIYFQAFEMLDRRFSIKVHPNGNYKMPNICILITHQNIDEMLDLLSIPSFVGQKLVVLVTPGEIYTSYEKLFMPFDKTAWSLLLLTFAIAFLTIGTLNFASKKLQNLVFGDKVRAPIFNVLSTFFGIPQTKLPNKNFGRLILILFVWFCLIFRTAYQGVLYELITTQIRKPIPETITELIDHNYSIYGMDKQIGVIDRNIFEGSDGQKLKFEKIDYDNFKILYAKNSENSAARMGLIIVDLSIYSLNEILNQKIIWNKLNEEINSAHLNLVFFHSSFFYEQMKKIYSRLAAAGIVHYLYNKNINNSKEFSPQIDDQKVPQVFTLNELSFGFVIWLGTLSVAVIVFLIEIFIWLIKNKEKKQKKLKFAKVAPMKNCCQGEIKKKVDYDKFRIKKCRKIIKENKEIENNCQKNRKVKNEKVRVEQSINNIGIKENNKEIKTEINYSKQNSKIKKNMTEFNNHLKENGTGKELKSNFEM
ncbi:hypothetical protein PVAND_001429 [Polypedilum vanderplanki]|uniref:Ionotropic receptor n=1 Tax=Polypedilum vanderplanki TaxID=319348 RepID=A0A9J6BMY0_POLVA|nr:hypothetical protein PVAND_001429 [Polypedilum vanderplanki]